jgi:hypothetical protein
MSKLSKVFSIVTILLSVLGFAIMLPEIRYSVITLESTILFGLSLAIIPYIITQSIKDLT